MNVNEESKSNSRRTGSDDLTSEPPNRVPRSVRRIDEVIDLLLCRRELMGSVQSLPMLNGCGRIVEANITSRT